MDTTGAMNITFIFTESLLITGDFSSTAVGMQVQNPCKTNYLCGAK